MTRRSRIQTATRLVAALALLATTGACSADVPKIKSGVCVAKEMGDAGRRMPDLASIVPCSEPHIYEVYDIADLPPEARDTRSEPPLSDDGPKDPEQRQVFDAASQQCTTSFLRATGYHSLTVNAKSASAAGLIPALRGVQAPLFSVMSESWPGRRQVVCSARMTVPVAADGGAGDGWLLLSAARTDAFPAALRRCRAYGADRVGVAEVSCERPHVSELLFFFEADQAFGMKFARELAANPTAEKFDRFDRACTAALPQLLGKGVDKELRGFGSVARSWTARNTTVRCDVGPVDFRTKDLPAGSLVGTRGVDVKLLEVAVPEVTP